MIAESAWPIASTKASLLLAAALRSRFLILAERLLYGVVVGGVGRQIEQFTTLLLDQLSNPLRPVGREVVHHHDLSRTQAGHEYLLYIGLEDSGGGRPFYGQRRSHPVEGHTRK